MCFHLYDFKCQVTDPHTGGSDVSDQLADRSLSERDDTSRQ